MEEKSFDELIQELQRLRIREGQIIAQIEQAHHSSNTRIPNQDNTRLPSNITSTRQTFTKGDRVLITNKIRKPKTAGINWTESKERLAVVSKIVNDQIHVVTDNGTNTWRIQDNLKRFQ
jgi:formylmethanofuran dehydrogenase subunit A